MQPSFYHSKPPIMLSVAKNKLADLSLCILRQTYILPVAIKLLKKHIYPTHYICNLSCKVYQLSQAIGVGPVSVIILCYWWLGSNEGLRLVPGMGLGPRGWAWSHADSLCQLSTSFFIVYEWIPVFISMSKVITLAQLWYSLIFVYYPYNHIDIIY